MAEKVFLGDLTFGDLDKRQVSINRRFTAGEAISQGNVVMFNGTAAMKCTQAGSPIGVAIEAISNGQTGRVCIYGWTQVLVASATTVAVHSILMQGSTAGLAVLHTGANFGGAMELVGVGMESSASGSNRLVWAFITPMPTPALLAPSGEITSVDTSAGAATDGASNSAARADHKHANLTIECMATFGKTGTATTGTGAQRAVMYGGWYLDFVDLACETAPTGASLIADLNLNGVTVFTNQTNRPTIAVSTKYDASGTIAVPNISDGQYLSADIDQVGSTVAGADWVLRAWGHRV